MPHAWDSIATSPKDSLYDGTTVRSAARYQSGKRRLGHRRLEPHHVGDTELGTECLQGVGLREPGARRPTDHRDDEAPAQSGVVGEQLRHRADEHVGRLQRLDPPDEQQHDGVRRQAQASTGVRDAAGAEEVEVDARGER